MFKREEPQHPIIAEDLRGAIKSHDERNGRFYRGSRGFPSRRSRVDSRPGTDFLTNDTQSSDHTSRRSATETRDIPHVDPAFDSPSLRMFLTHQGQEHIFGENGLRNVGPPRALQHPSQPMDAHSLPLMRDYRMFSDSPGLAQASHSANDKYGARTVVRGSSNHPGRVVGG